MASIDRSTLTARMPPYARDRIARERAASTAVAASSAIAAPHGLVCLMIATRRSRSVNAIAQVLDELERRGGVEQVVVAERLAVQLRSVDHASAPATPGRRRARPAGAGSRRSADRRPWRAAARAAPGTACRSARPIHRADRGVVLRRCARTRPPRARGAARARSRRRSHASRSTTRVVLRRDRSTTVTNAWFFAAERIIAGPPMSICSIASPVAHRPRRTVCSNG